MDCINEYAEPVDKSVKVCSNTCNFLSITFEAPYYTECIEDGKDCKDIEKFELTA